jgi:hypothetical protein
VAGAVGGVAGGTDAVDIWEMEEDGILNVLWPMVSILVLLSSPQKKSQQSGCKESGLSYRVSMIGQTDKKWERQILPEQANSH